MANKTSYTRMMHSPESCQVTESELASWQIAARTAAPRRQGITSRSSCPSMLLESRRSRVFRSILSPDARNQLSPSLPHCAMGRMPGWPSAHRVQPSPTRCAQPACTTLLTEGQSVADVWTEQMSQSSDAKDPHGQACWSHKVSARLQTTMTECALMNDFLHPCQGEEWEEIKAARR